MTSSLQMNPHTLPHHGIPDGTLHGQAHGHGLAKLTKPRSRTHKPILKRLHSHTDRGSLDLDRGWNEQPSPMLASSGPYDGPNSPGSFCFPGPSSNAAYRPIRDMAPSALVANLDHHGLADTSRARGAHARSISGTSLVSIATTNTSGDRTGGSFVHSFQQTPQTSLPPLSHARSRASLEDRDDPDHDSYLGPRPREPSPTITEDGNDTDDAHSLQPSGSSATRFRHHPPSNPAQHRRASQLSQRTTTSADGSMLLRPPLASHSHTGSIQVLSCESLKQSRSDLQLSAQGSVVDASVTTLTPLETTTGGPGSAAQASASASVTAHATAPAQRPAPLPHAPSSGPAASLRSSFDMTTLRIRSRSELDTATRQEHVREARRKFEVRERTKEKYAREENRKRLRADTKEAQKLEREQARLKNDVAFRKSTESRSNKVLRRRGSRPAPPVELPKDEKASAPGSGGDSPHTQTSTPTTPPTADDVHFKSSKRPKRAKYRTSKRSTAGMWTAFVLWLRTRLLRLGKR